jgi:hypothetical protein
MFLCNADHTFSFKLQHCAAVDVGQTELDITLNGYLESKGGVSVSSKWDVTSQRPMKVNKK